MAYPIEDESEFVNRTALNPIAIEEAAFDFREYNKGEGVQDLSDQVIYRTGSWTQVKNRDGVRGYQKPYLAAQKTRVRRFHEILNDYLSGNPPNLH